jgi:hypothetical protein
VTTSVQNWRPQPPSHGLPDIKKHVNAVSSLSIVDISGPFDDAKFPPMQSERGGCSNCGLCVAQNSRRSLRRIESSVSPPQLALARNLYLAPKVRRALSFPFRSFGIHVRLWRSQQPEIRPHGRKETTTDFWPAQDRKFPTKKAAVWASPNTANCRRLVVF